MSEATLDERDRHETCATDQLQVCDLRLNSSIEAQLREIEAAASRNMPRVEQARQAAVECSNHQWELITSVNRYIEVLAAAGYGAGLDEFRCSDPVSLGLQGQAVSLTDARRSVELEVSAIEHRVASELKLLQTNQRVRTIPLLSRCPKFPFIVTSRSNTDRLI